MMRAALAPGMVVLVAVLVVSVIAPAAGIKAGLYAAAVGGAGVGLFLLCLSPAPRREMAQRSLLIVVAMPILAWSLSNVWLLCLVMCFWVPLFAARVGQIVPIYLLSMLLLPGLDSPMWLLGIRLADFGVHNGLALGAAIAIGRSPAKGRPRPQHDLAAGAVMLLLAVALSRETSPLNLLRVSADVVFDVGLPYYVLSRGLRSSDELRTAMRWLACGGSALASLMTFETWRSWPIFTELYTIYQLPTVVLVKSRGGLMRSGGPFIESTSAALVVSICALALWLSRDQFRSGRAHWLMSVVVFVGLAAPQSRGAWIGLCLALFFADAYRARYAAMAKKVGLTIAGGALLVLLVQPSPTLSESLGLAGQSSDTAEYRRKLFDRGMEEFRKRPLTGYPVPELQWRLNDLRQGEGIIDFVNTYLWILLISGVTGFAVFAGAWLHFLRGLWRRRRAFPGGGDDSQAGAFIFSCLAMLMIMLLFTSFGGRPAFLTFGMFGFATALLSRQQSARSSKLTEGASDSPPAPTGIVVAGRGIASLRSP